MPINVSEALDSDLCLKLTVKRKTGGTHVDGLWVPGVESTFVSMISPQQPTAQEILVLPEGERSKDVMKFISKRVIRQADDKSAVEADVVLYDSKEYKIIKAEKWGTFGHTIGYGTRIL